VCVLAEGFSVFSASGRRFVTGYIGEEIVVDVVHDFYCRDFTAV
jgi:hypothetical protein